VRQKKARSGHRIIAGRHVRGREGRPKLGLHGEFAGLKGGGRTDWEKKNVARCWIVGSNERTESRVLRQRRGRGTPARTNCRLRYGGGLRGEENPANPFSPECGREIPSRAVEKVGSREKKTD